ncbi:hypothetical protein N9E67_00680 [Amylibacter sp.]|nr:hypothetical protein [Amylibacter sp.]
MSVVSNSKSSISINFVKIFSSASTWALASSSSFPKLINFASKSINPASPSTAANTSLVLISSSITSGLQAISKVFVSAINNYTKHSVKISKFSIRTDRVDEYYEFWNKKTDIDTDTYKFVEPGEEYIVDDWGTLNGMVFKKDEPLTEKPKKFLDDKLSKEFAEKFGCKSQFGSVHVMGYFPEIVQFPDEANINTRDSYKSLVGSLSGVFPLNELIKPF